MEELQLGLSLERRGKFEQRRGRVVQVEYTGMKRSKEFLQGVGGVPGQGTGCIVGGRKLGILALLCIGSGPSVQSLGF